MDDDIKELLKDIEYMIPFKFNFDFGYHNAIKETYQHEPDEDPDEDNELQDGKDGVYYFYNLDKRDYRGVAEENFRILPSLKLIYEYYHIIFKNGRKFIIDNKQSKKVEITDIISLFRFLQTTKNYAIFNNLLNVMLILIIDFITDTLRVIGDPSFNLEKEYVKTHNRKLYKKKDNSVILTNSNLYNIEKKNCQYYSQELNRKINTFINNNWLRCNNKLLEYLELDTGRRYLDIDSFSGSLYSEFLEVKSFSSLFEDLNNSINILDDNITFFAPSLNTSLKYQYIIDNHNDKGKNFEDKLALINYKKMIDDLYNDILKHNGPKDQKKLEVSSGSSSSFGSIGSPPKDLPTKEQKLKYQFIMDNIDAFPSIATEHNMKLINTSNKYMNEIKGVFEATNYAKSSYENIEDSKIPIYIYIYSKENKLYITYQIGDRYKRDPVIPLNIMELNQEILFKNEHILKELYNILKGVIKQPKGGKVKRK
jgi:hypothetical protein